MKTLLGIAILTAAVLGAAKAEESWIKQLADRTERGSLADRRETIRGDTGKWNDEPKLAHTPPIQRKPPQQLLDNWVSDLAEKPVPATNAGEDNWLVFQTRQLDDNDRVWIEKIERQGNKFTIVLSQAVWQGRYPKNFTFYEVLAVNLGKLEAGDYEATWIVKPLRFRAFDDAPDRRNAWPKDEEPVAEDPVELRTTFTVAAPR